MEINGIGVAGLLGSSIGQAAGEFSETSSAKLKTKATSEHQQDSRARRHHDHHHDNHRRGKALGMLRQEIRYALAESFRFRFAATLPAYNENVAALAADDVASDALGAAKQVANRAPLNASRTLSDFRQKIESAASNVRQSIGETGLDDVDDAVGRVSKGLDDLDNDAARNLQSSATVLSADTRVKQRSSIRIRTQEGDIVRFDLRLAERMSAQDVSMTDGDTTYASTKIEMSSRSRMVLRVDGDLNEAELAAVQNVFAQAESIANEFFDGDLAAAFNMAAGLEFDSEQLARVGMRFHEKQVSNVSYGAISAAAMKPPAEPAPAVVSHSGPFIPTTKISLPEPGPIATPPPVREPEAPAVADLREPVAAPVNEPPAAPVAEPEAALPEQDGIGRFMEMLSSFMQSINEGFELDSESGSFRYYFSQSFKLEILKSVMEVRAPEESGDAADTAATLIDAVSATSVED